MSGVPALLSAALPGERFDYGALDEHSANQARATADRIRERRLGVEKSLFEIGRDLIAVKSILDHGQFGKWLDAEFGWSERTARNMMSASELADTKSATVSVLPAAAIYKLAAPSTPEAARDAIIGQIEGGANFTTKEINAIVAEARKKETVEREAQARLQRKLRGKSQVEQERIRANAERLARKTELEAQKRRAEIREADEAAAELAAFLRERLGRDLSKFLDLAQRVRYGRFDRVLDELRQEDARARDSDFYRFHHDLSETTEGAA